MKYYRPKEEKYDHFTGYTTIIGELLTEKERNRRFPHIADNVFEIVNVSRKQTTFFFGKRIPYTSAKVEVIKSF